MENQIEGLSNRRDNRIYVGMWSGGGKAYFTRKAEANAEGAHHRLTKNNTDRWEYRYDTITGLIDKVYVKKDEKYGYQWIFEISYKDNQFVLTLGYDSGRALSLLKQLPNCDLSREVELQAAEDRIFVAQDGHNIKWYWSQEANPLPAWDWYDDPSTGKKKANKTKEIKVIKEFYEEHMAQRFSYLGFNPNDVAQPTEGQNPPPPEKKEETPPPPTEEPPNMKSEDDELEEIFGPSE